MCIKSMYDSGFKGIVTRQCKGAPTHEPYVYSNDCKVIRYKNACILKQPTGYMLVYTGSDIPKAFVHAHEWVDPTQSTLDSFIKGD